MVEKGVLCVNRLGNRIGWTSSNTICNVLFQRRIEQATSHEIASW